MQNIWVHHSFYYIFLLLLTFDVKAEPSSLISPHDIAHEEKHSDASLAESSKDLWRKLWEDHISWMRSVMVAKIDDLGGEEAYKSRLLQNSVDMEKELLRIYGEECRKLSTLISKHLEIADKIFTYVKIRDIKALYYTYSMWNNNGHEIALEMNNLNPNFWPLNVAERMWGELRDATLKQATNHEKGNFEEEVAAYDLAHNSAIEIADFFSSGIIRQFP